MSNSAFNVLLIENDFQQAELLRKVLAKSKEPVFNLIFHNTLKEGLDRLANAEIHLILLDLGMEPESHGFETFERVRAVSRDIPIIVLSGNDDEALAIQTVQNGAQDYLVKGHDDNPHWLLRSMQYALERKRAQQDLKVAYDELERRVVERTAELRKSNNDLQHEVAERRRAEEALRETQQQIIQQERLHALGRMASGIAHDFNNALAPILGFSELLLIRPEIFDDRERTRSYIQMINTAAKDSATVVGRLREFYRYREPAETSLPVVLNDLVQQVILLTQPKWKDQALAAGINIKIETDFKNTPTISGNESELREMLTNIVFNSVDAVIEKKGGTVTFRTFQMGNSIVLQVCDNGIGMSEEVRLRCLEPFFSTKSDHGTGLGLGIVYGIVRRHGGKIDIESEVGKGTTVTVSLPIHKDEAPPEPETWETAKVNKRILVVEDEPLVREVISVYLGTDNHDVTTAVDGVDGLEKYRAGKFDIVLTDRAMPQMNGDLLAQAIKKIDPDKPIILLTGFGDIMLGSGEQPGGVDLVLSKPFTMSQLRDAIGKFIS
ncbi:MAG TPA: response regulator [Chthoniobacteraceae bacterium]|nr:response regulator [Chthoniobacteraceae bacterium]